MPPESDFPPATRGATLQIVHPRSSLARRRAALAFLAVAAVVFIVVCVLVGESVSAPTHARANGDAASELPSTGSPIGMIAVLMAVALSLLATVVVIRMVARSSGAEEVEDRPADQDAAPSGP